MTPTDWNTALRPEATTKECDAFIATIARARLLTIEPAEPLTSRELVELLYPERYAVMTNEGAAARKRIVTALAHRDRLPVGALADCVSDGPPVYLRYARKTVARILWHKPIAGIRCPYCRGFIPTNSGGENDL